MPTVSVIVPTHNRAPLLDDSIRSVLAGCEGVAAEVIYVNDASADATDRVLAAHADRVRSLNVRCRAPGLARNAGAAVARGEFLLFTDDDCLLPEGWAEGMLRARSAHGCDALSGGFRATSMATSAERYAEYRMAINFGAAAKPVAAAPMMSFLVRRAAFEAVGGFAPLRLTSLEDWEFCYRLAAAGHSLVYDPVVTVGHKYASDWGPMWRRLVDTAWLGPLVWRSGGIGVPGKIARDTVRCLGSPLWCLRYFPMDLYPRAVALEVAYYAVRLAAVIASGASGGSVYRRRLEQADAGV